jgi:hypothetical protein
MRPSETRDKPEVAARRAASRWERSEGLEVRDGQVCMSACGSHLLHPCRRQPPLRSVEARALPVAAARPGFGRSILLAHLGWMVSGAQPALLPARGDHGRAGRRPLRRSPAVSAAVVDIGKEQKQEKESVGRHHSGAAMPQGRPDRRGRYCTASAIISAFSAIRRRHGPLSPRS